MDFETTVMTRRSIRKFKPDPVDRDTIKSVLTLASDLGIDTEERRISIDEVLSDAREAFVTGTAAGISFIESITHGEKTAEFSGREMGEVTRSLLKL